MQLERLRLAGFKSFVDPVELVIGPGLTGIVGPNGCGKSNLVEALRWVMGESSARRLRGGEMDDVIFGGSERRPARNLAEVALTLDNGARAAPLAFNDSATIEVSRRILRGAGSTYRINGREARARDVQLLFADAASGPHSGALVGQGRIGALIAATPRDRRTLLDEAAGTAGIYARRHEAELRLRAAEENLGRLDDVTATLAAQIETLKKQARQATRYRRLGEQIRQAEALLLHIKWRQAAGDAERVAAELRDAERGLAALGEGARACERAREEAEAAVPPLRRREAAAAADIQTLVHTGEALAQELAQVTAARQEAERRLVQIVGDRTREAGRLADAAGALATLEEERTALERAGGGAETERRNAASRAETAARDLTETDARLTQATGEAAAAEARRAALDRTRRDLLDRHSRLASRLADSERQREALRAASAPPEEIAAAGVAVTQAAADAERARAAAAEAAETLSAAQRRDAAALDRARDADRVLAPLEAEAKALSRILAPGDTSRSRAEGPALLAQLRVKSGFEAAVAALFDGELAAPLLSAPEKAAGAGWIALPISDPAPPAVRLPEGVRSLAENVAAPAVLARRLAHAFWVENAAEGWRLQPHLGPGQRLVDRDGRLWRWDGFVRIGAGASAAAELLRQRNRLDRLESEIAAARAQATHEAAAAARARAERETAAAAERAAAGQSRVADEKLARARRDEAELSRRGLAAEAKLAALVETIDRIAADLAELGRQIAETDNALALLPDPAAARAALDRARSEAGAARHRDTEARAALERVVRAAEGRRRRLAAIAGEAESWKKRHDEAAAQQQALAERHDAAAAEIATLAARPAAIAAQREALDASAAAAGAERQRAEAALHAAEATLRQTVEAARRAEAAIAVARERRAGLQARDAAAADTLGRLRAEIGERLGVGPDELGQRIAEDGEAGERDAADLAARLDRLGGERNAMGAVNLLAATQMEEVEARLGDIERERADLTAAIAQLRRGIAALDSEGRKRLTSAFDALNGHFGALFGRLFGGGHAELAWEGGDDPLDAGLDILARPPGKRLTSLSLLSGGEQALTALALIFAMFLTHPAPVCVLDEVDAPLDDANVDGFCRLVSDIAETTGTRFLVITHHRVTMAHMNRLFGVTMAERGISQLVSVDLARAAALRQTA